MPIFEENFRPRFYPHFDLPLARVDAKRLVTNPRRIESHSFFPFIHLSVKTPRYRKDEKKVTSKIREVMYSSHSDSAIYTWYSAVLSEYYETQIARLGIGDIAVAYRKLEGGPCNVHFANRAFDFIKCNLPCTALCFDVTAFFDNLDHGLLLKEWKDVLRRNTLPNDHYQVYRSLTRYSYVDRVIIEQLFGKPKRRKGASKERVCSSEDFRKRVRAGGYIISNAHSFGIPQGSPMSGVLSNLYMIPFDLTLKEIAESLNGFAQRYSDDIFLVIPSIHEDIAKKRLGEALDERLLEVQPAKCEIVHFYSDSFYNPLDVPVQYLGLTFDGRNIRIRPQTLARQCHKARLYLKRARKSASKNKKHPHIYRARFNSRFTHRGRRNFLKYGKLCLEETNSNPLKEQLNSHTKTVAKWKKKMDFPDRNPAYTVL